MTQRKYFGTDGIRGKANIYPMTAEVALRTGMAAAKFFGRGEHRHQVVIGKDPRLSGYMLEQALTAGFLSMGMNVVLVGPIPTPGIAMLTRALRCDLGVMISASHNHYTDNGIKLFGPDGNKLSDEAEMTIESLIETIGNEDLVTGDKLGRARRLDDVLGRYIEFAKQTFPKDLRLDNLRIVIDCSNGAAYKAAPSILYELGAEVIAIGVSPNGQNINEGVGSTAPKKMQEAVVEYRADIGIALDGDADRVIISDEKGQIIDGDQLMATIALNMKEQGQLKNNALVATVMSNLGLERLLEAQGMKLIRTAVGDRYVSEEMKKGGYNIGGEQSGHIVLSDYSTTGDGTLAALQILAIMARTKKKASDVCKQFTPVPQILKNVRFDKNNNPLEKEEVQNYIRKVEKELKGKGRLLIRSSGTEPVIRVMVEGDSQKEITNIVDNVIKIVEKA
ncbi:MAG: phosphoglucosamine mutase [Alphaproteobacteria bacterium]